MLKPHATTFPYPLVEHESIHSPGCQIFTNLTYPFVRSIQQSDRRACINAVLCYFLLIPWRNVGRKRPAGKDPGPYGRGGRNGAKSTDDPILGPEQARPFNYVEALFNAAPFKEKITSSLFPWLLSLAGYRRRLESAPLHGFFAVKRLFAYTLSLSLYLPFSLPVSLPRLSLST